MESMRTSIDRLYHFPSPFPTPTLHSFSGESSVALHSSHALLPRADAKSTVIGGNLVERLTIQGPMNWRPSGLLVLIDTNLETCQCFLSNPLLLDIDPLLDISAPHVRTVWTHEGEFCKSESP